ncbi:PD-(D/E)XK nuclease family protein [Patescibacteria group bacterium]|nr:PD-(D/E)XK nuclease family protein [Patescibacteria group bacterium]
MEIDIVSPSELNSFSQCPKKWYLGKIGRTGIAIDDSHMIFGREVHKVIGSYFSRISDNPTDDEIDYQIDETFQEELSLKDGRFNQKLQRIISNFKAFEKERRKKWKVYRPVFVERKVVYKPFKGVVDFYGLNDGVVIDWKTGGSAELYDSEIRQGNVYKFLLENNSYPVKKILFCFLDLGRALEVPMTTVGWVMKEYNNMVDMVRHNQFPKRESKLCEQWCPYILDCQFCKMCLWEGM